MLLNIETILFSDAFFPFYIPKFPFVFSLEKLHKTLFSLFDNGSQLLVKRLQILYEK